MTVPRLTLLTRPGCHLCGPVRRRVEAVARATGATWEEIDIDTDPRLRAQYTDKVPVVLIDGRVHAYWRVDERDLLGAVRRHGSRWRGIIRLRPRE